MTGGSTAPAAPRSRWILWVLIGLAIGALAFAIGRFSTFAPAASVALPGTSSPEAGFARDMQVHHTQAIEMAMEIYRKTDDEELRILSYDIATAQASQKGEMYDWLVKWGLPQSGGPMMQWMQDAEGHAHGDGGVLTAEEARVAMGMASSVELANLSSATGQEADCLFLDLMIRHHQGAIPMAEALLDLGSEERALAVAQSMKTGQTAEIDAMQAMQSRLACAG